MDLKRHSAIVDLRNLLVLEKAALQDQVHDVQIPFPLWGNNGRLVNDQAGASVLEVLSEAWKELHFKVW
jgi:hypothetical protein